MLILELLPVVLSLVVLGAHFLREGNMPLLALVLGLLALVFVRRPWAATDASIKSAIAFPHCVRSFRMRREASSASAGEPDAQATRAFKCSIRIRTGCSRSAMAVSSCDQPCVTEILA